MDRIDLYTWSHVGKIMPTFSLISDEESPLQDNPLEFIPGLLDECKQRCFGYPEQYVIAYFVSRLIKDYDLYLLPDVEATISSTALLDHYLVSFHELVHYDMDSQRIDVIHFDRDANSGGTPEYNSQEKEINK